MSVVLAVASCGTGGGRTTPRETAASYVLPTIRDGTTAGVAERFERSPGLLETDGPPPPGTLRLVGCRLRAPGVHVYDLEFEARDAVTFPLEIRLEMMRLVSDMVSDSSSGTVVLHSAGAFSIATNVLERNPRDPRAWAADSRSLGEREGECWVRTPGATPVRSVPISIDPIPMTVTAPAGSLQALAQAGDLRAEHDTGVALAYLLARDQDLPLDRLWLPGGIGIDSIRVEYGVGGGGMEPPAPQRCRSATLTASRGTPDAPGRSALTVHQRAGCPTPAPRDGVATVADPDGIWTVTVEASGPDLPSAEVIAASVHAHPLAGAKPITRADVTFDASGHLDTLVRGRDELTRLPWRDGLVAVVRGDGMACCEQWGGVAVTSTEAGTGGGTGSACRTYSSSISLSPTGGYALVVTRAAELRSALRLPDRPESRIDLQPATGGHFVGLVDIAPLPEGTPMNPLWVVVSDPAGKEVPCEQS